jgi:hypothetical protein
VDECLDLKYKNKAIIYFSCPVSIKDPDPHVLGLPDPDPLVSGADPDPLVRGADPAPDPSLFS